MVWEVPDSCVVGLGAKKSFEISELSEELGLSTCLSGLEFVVLGKGEGKSASD